MALPTKQMKNMEVKEATEKEIATKTFESFSDRLIKNLYENRKKIKTDDKTFSQIVQMISDFDQTERDRKKNAPPGEMTFGKYRGKQLADIYKLDPSYCMWLAKNNKYLSQENQSILTKLITAK